MRVLIFQDDFKSIHAILYCGTPIALHREILFQKEFFVVQRHRAIRQTHKGFSLVELMIVLVLLTIMLGFAVPLSMNWYRRQMLDMEIERLAAAYKLGLKLATTHSRYYAMIIDYTPPSGAQPGVLNITYRFQNCVATNNNIDCSTWPEENIRETVRLTFEQMTANTGTLPADWKLIFFTPLGEIKHCVIADCFAANANLTTGLQYVPSDLTLEFSHPLSKNRKGSIILSGGGLINAVTR